MNCILNKWCCKTPLLVLDYRWSHNSPTYWRTVTPNWYRTHTIPKFSLQTSWITGACHNTRRHSNMWNNKLLQRKFSNTVCRLFWAMIDIICHWFLLYIQTFKLPKIKSFLFSELSLCKSSSRSWKKKFDLQDSEKITP